MEAQARNTEGNKKEKFSIRLVKPADFDACAQTRMTTIKDLSVQVNAVMATAYDDYIGCNLACLPVPNNVPVIAPCLYFRMMPNDVYENTEVDANGNKKIVTAFKPVMVKNDDILDKLKIMSSPASITGKMVEMTTEGKEGLSDIVFKPSNANNDWWKKTYSMRTNIGGEQETYICFGGFINNNALLKKVFGYTDGDGSNVEYQINPIRPLMGQNEIVTGQIANWALNIMRLSKDSLDRSAEMYGMVTAAYNAMPMVRADRR